MLNPSTSPTTNKTRQHQVMQSYYQFQSRIYDSTRWSFLFGRKALIDRFPLESREKHRILEIGCGTGTNLGKLASRYAYSDIIGYDVSSSMLRIASKKTADLPNVELRHEAYGHQKQEQEIDGIIFSYSLSMINPQWEQLLNQAYKDLRPGGFIGVVDFRQSQFGWFQRHMASHHVRMEAHLEKQLEKNFQMKEWEVQKAYGGLWEYFTFIGQKL